MISAQELRDLQKSFLQNKEEEILCRFKTAVSQYESILMKECENAITIAQKNNLTYTFLDFQPLTKSYEGFYYTAVLYGLWKGENLFTKHSIVSPFDRVNKELERFGYHLENVSDMNKSNRLYIKLSWYN